MTSHSLLENQLQLRTALTLATNLDSAVVLALAFLAVIPQGSASSFAVAL
jgi:hypothetical protein